jgi:hypothetical protein
MQVFARNGYNRHSGRTGANEGGIGRCARTGGYTFRKEQLFLLQQMQEIRKAMSPSQPLEHGLHTIITDR